MGYNATVVVLLDALHDTPAERTDGAVVKRGKQLVTRAEFNALIQVLQNHLK